MEDKTRQILINKLAAASGTTNPETIKHEGQRLTVVLPISDRQAFDAAREKKLAALKSELDNILSLIRQRLNSKLPEEIEAELAAHREKIEQQLKNAQ